MFLGIFGLVCGRSLGSLVFDRTLEIWVWVKMELITKCAISVVPYDCHDGFDMWVRIWFFLIKYEVYYGIATVGTSEWCLLLLG